MCEGRETHKEVEDDARVTVVRPVVVRPITGTLTQLGGDLINMENTLYKVKQGWSYVLDGDMNNNNNNNKIPFLLRSKVSINYEVAFIYLSIYLWSFIVIFI